MKRLLLLVLLTATLAGCAVVSARPYVYRPAVVVY
ncbi:lipoprotein [Paraburkholderia hospita]